MRNVWLAVRHEASTVLHSRAFWIMTVTFPLLLVALTTLPELASRRVFGSAARGMLQRRGAAVGYVDPGGLIASLPPELADGSLRVYPDEAAAQAALERGEMTEYYVVPADYLETGRIVLVEKTLSPLANLGGMSILEQALTYNLVGDEVLANRLQQPIQRLDAKPLRTGPAPPQTPEEVISAFTLPFGVMFILFFILTVSAGYMLQSVSKEKENRTAEVLLLSLRPRELMLGKLIGLGFVALVQMGFWLGGGLLMGRGREVLAMAGGGRITPVLVAWAAAYFLFGYIVYASALGALGALTPGLREGSQLTFVLLLPLMLPMVLNTTFVRAPNGLLATILSLFPLTAPTSMVTRMVAADVPAWQPVVGLLGLALTAYLFVLIAAHFFRAETLLSSAPLRWPLIRHKEAKTRSSD